MSQRWKEQKSPDLQIDDFSLWVFNRQFENSHDYWDGNWLNVYAEVRTNGAVVKADGAILRVPELAGFADELQRVYDTLQGEAQLKCIEPNLGITIRAEKTGHLEIEIEITPDHMAQRHKFMSGFDQTFLKPIITSLRSILATYPIRN